MGEEIAGERVRGLGHEPVRDAWQVHGCRAVRRCFEGQPGKAKLGLDLECRADALDGNAHGAGPAGNRDVEGSVDGGALKALRPGLGEGCKGAEGSRGVDAEFIASHLQGARGDVGKARLLGVEASLPHGETGDLGAPAREACRELCRQEERQVAAGVPFGKGKALHGWLLDVPGCGGCGACGGAGAAGRTGAQWRAELLQQGGCALACWRWPDSGDRPGMRPGRDSSAGGQALSAPACTGTANWHLVEQGGGRVKAGDGLVASAVPVGLAPSANPWCDAPAPACRGCLETARCPSAPARFRTLERLNKGLAVFGECIY